MEEQKKLIYEAIPKVMAAIGAIGKNQRNSSPGQGNYRFRGIDDLYNAVNLALSTNKVFCYPQVLEHIREERKSKSGGLLLYTIIKVKYTCAAEDGSFIEVITLGEAMDSGDKGSNKAMSAAQKYALIQLFCITTEEPKDTENETHELAVEKNKKPEETTTNFKFLNLMKDYKETLGEAGYRAVLNRFGFEKSNEILKHEDQVNVWNAMKQRIKDNEEVFKEHA